MKLIIVGNIYIEHYFFLGLSTLSIGVTKLHVYNLTNDDIDYYEVINYVNDIDDNYYWHIFIHDCNLLLL